MTDEYKTPHVYSAISKILESLSVDKGGQLPQNMGGKPYITAVDVSLEVKRQFVDNSLIYLPNEQVIWHEYIQFNNRLNVGLGISGRYTIISTVDGSSVEVTGTGDGLAMGTAVASNIASTNALKNALLRTFLITEQSAEDAAKAGVEAATTGADGPTQAQKAIAKAKPAEAKSDSGLDAARQAVKDAWQAVHGDEDDFEATGYMTLGKSKFEPGWPNRAADLKKLAKAITDGEVA